MLRRERLYSSLLVNWRRERDAGMLKGLTPAKRGPRSRQNSLDAEVGKLRSQNARLTEDLRKAGIIIDVQKKLATLLERWPVRTKRPGSAHERRCSPGFRCRRAAGL